MNNDQPDWPATLGTQRAISSHHPFALTGADTMWFVSEGAVFIFLHETSEGELSGRKIPLFTVKSGEIMVGFTPPDDQDEWVIAGVAGNNTVLSSFRIDDFWQQTEENQERAESLLGLWQQHLQSLPSAITENVEGEFAESDIRAGSDYLRANNVVFYNQALQLIESFEKNWQASYAEKEQTKINILDATFRSMRDVIQGVAVKRFDPKASSVVNSCNLVLSKLGVGSDFRLRGIEHSATLPNTEKVRNIAQASGVRVRSVALNKGTWWQHDGVPMVGFLAETDEAVALIPTGHNSYRAFERGHSTVVDRSYVDRLQDEAWTFYRPFPNKPITFWNLLTFSLGGTGWDITFAVLWGGVIALLAMIQPIATNQVFNFAIPHADRELLLQMLVILVSIAITSWGVSFVQSISIVRFTTRADYSTQAAVWDRLLALPVSFFRDFSAGDLADRAMSITKIKQTISAGIITGIITGLFSITSVIMMLYYSWQLAITAIVFISFFALLSCGVSYAIYRYQVILADKEGELSGLTLQFFTGIIKLRAAHAETEAFHNWAEIFREKKEAYRKSALWQTSLQALGKNLKLFVMIALFFVYFTFLRTDGTGNGLSSGSFMAFYSAYGSFQAAVMMMLQGFFVSLHCIPQYQRLKPILDAQPELSSDKPIPHKLTGEITINDVVFRYAPESPLILKDVSLEILSGEFVAIVGDSGSGKSTLLRLLLGFEFPEGGSIFYDSSDMSKVDLRGLRRQIGVVLQDGKILQGSIFDNIVGSSALLNIDDAWKAAKMAGCEEDIRAMPMGMQTVVTAGGGTLSGGQRQRIMIARAIVSSPKILFFDEATSALDNKTQKIVSDSLESLQSTRIVIAHRLSTIEKADKIYVLEKGRIVERGTYQDLMDSKGSFYELAKRQIA